MLNWILSPMTRLDWLIVLAVIMAFIWLCTTPIGLRFIMKWSIKSSEKAFKHMNLFGEEDEEDGLY